MTATSSPELTVLPAMTQAAAPARIQPVHVPGYGWVEWPADLLDAQARYLSFIHRPDRRSVRTRLRCLLGRSRLLPRVCTFCGAAWPCAEGGWARRWLVRGTRRRWRRSTSRQVGPEKQRRHRRQGRHRARAIRRLARYGGYRRPPRLSRGGRRQI